MSSNRAWRGAVELAGFPINVALYSRVKTQRTESFKTLAPSGQPVRQQYVDPGNDDAVVPRDQTRKGVPLPDGDGFAVLTDEAQDAITSGVKTELAELKQLAPASSVPWDLAINRYSVLPDDKVPGAGDAVNILWNGLRESGLAYITQISLRGGHDSILAIHADDSGLYASALPFEVELYEVPAHQYVADEDQAQVFEQFTEANYSDKIGEFAHDSFVSEYRTRREAAIASVLAGREVKVKAPKAKAAVPDLMAALSAGVKKPKPTGPAKKPTKKKVTA